MIMTAGKTVCCLPTTERNQRNSEGCFIRLKDGSIIYAWSEYYNCNEDLGQADIGCIRSYDEGDTWCERRVLFGNGQENLMCPHLMRMQNGDLGLIYVYHDDCKN
ncbi:MAG: exo-alpha-sialidase, partial [Lachnospiraceae bacterium]|nr:exo-alpha-sialidase [Lachnospiraceae bacterium]